MHRIRYTIFLRNSSFVFVFQFSSSFERDSSASRCPT